MEIIRFLRIDNHLIENKPWAVFWVPVVVAFLVRIIYHFLDVPDFWGDSYHSMYMTWATLENDWVYSDYKGRHVVWMPFYRYLSTFFIWVFQTYDLIVPQFLNMILGSITCGVVAVFTARLADQRMGIFSGIILALASWHVAYSHMNMPEITAMLILILALYTWSIGKSAWLILLGFAGVLTRNELTLLLGVFGAILLIRQQWKPAMYLFIGSVIGLGLWVWWNFAQRGELFWWIRSRSSGSSWDRHFVIMQGAYSNDMNIHLIIFLSVIPVIIIPLLFATEYFPRIKRIPVWKVKELFALDVIVVFHWVFLLLMSTEYFTAPNGRYWLYSLPLACSVFGIWTFYAKDRYRNWIIVFSNLILVATTAFMFFLLNKNHKIYAFHQDMGEYIGTQLPQEANIWLDFPDILYFSGIDPARAYSSDQLMPIKDRNTAEEERLEYFTERFEKNNIRYLIASPVSYSIIHFLWPQMEERQPFTWGHYHFTPIFSKFSTVDQKVKKPYASWMRYFGGVNKKAVLWRIDRLYDSSEVRLTPET